jgi:predicted RNase H-like HicB family nuclease
MVAMTTWIADVEREGDFLLATVRDLPGAHTFASDIESLDAAVREVIALVLDLPDDPARLDVAFAFAVPA